MSELSQIKIDDVVYNIKDANARQNTDDLKNANSQLADHLGYNINQNYTGFQIGFYANGTGVYNPSRTDYVCTKSIIEVEPNSTVYLSDIPNAGQAYLITYDANRQYVNKGLISGTISNHKIQLTVPADIYYVHIDIINGQNPMNPADYADVIINTTQNTDVIAGLDARITDNTKRSTENKNVLSKISNYNQFGGWTVGLFSNANGAYVGNRTDYLCISEKMPVSEGDIVQLTVNAPTILQYIYIQWYDSNDTLLSHSDYGNKREAIAFAPTDASYFHVSISKMYGEPMVMSDYMDTVLYIGISETDALSNILALRNNSDNLLLVNWTNFIYFFGQGHFGYTDNRIGLLSTFKTKYKYRVKAENGYMIAAGSFSSETPSLATETGNTGWVSETVLEKDTYYIMNCRKSDDSNISADNYANPHITISRISEDREIGANYAVGSDFLKKDIGVTNIGTLTYAQSFCKYDDYYYSVDGENISKQDSTFTEVSNAVLGTGHGNSLQLGHNGKAYASGWNDQKVYEVDLTTLTITNTYTLPTTGYTTVAVDDINKLMYIFQRATFPDTLENYNFIVYDYANEQIVSTKKTTVAFGAMQAVDFVDGRIFVLNGLGTAAVPNGYRIYNTNGDIIAEYVLGSFATHEPEGICIDRDTQDILISFGAKVVYKIA